MAGLLMGDDQTQEDAEGHPTKKWQNHRATPRTKAVAAIIVYGLFIAIDVHDIWPWSKLAAIIAGALVSIALLYYEAFAAGAIDFLTFVIGSVVICFAGLVIYREVPEHTVPETETIGTLQPGAQPDPASKCPPPTTPDTWKILIGTSAIQLAEAAEIPLLAVGKCKVLTVAKGRDGLSIAADLFDADGKLIANIKDNTFHALSGNHASIERDNDLSKIIIKDGSGKEILNIHYMNKSTVRVRGIFGCPGHALVPVKDGEPIPRVMMAGACINVAGGIKLGNAFFGVQ
jgi:hypothetical protein